MAIRKLVLVSSVVLALAACGGGGGSTVGSLGSKLLPNSTNTPTTPTAPATPSAQALTVDVADLKAQKVAELKEALAGKVDLSGIDLSKSNYRITVDKQTYTSGQIDLRNHSKLNEVSDADITQTLSQSVGGTNYAATEKGKVRAYRQDYSIVAGYSREAAALPALGLYEGGADMEIQLVQGRHTQTLPTAGAFDYKGKAFSETETGDLNYRVDFGTRKGSGDITGIADAGKITLLEADIGNIRHTNDMTGRTVSGPGISGNAISENAGSGEYQLGFFGPNAEEIAGAVYNNRGVVGFGGKKQ